MDGILCTSANYCLKVNSPSLTYYQYTETRVDTGKHLGPFVSLLRLSDL